MKRLLGLLLLPFALAGLLLVTILIGLFDRAPQYRRNQLDAKRD